VTVNETIRVTSGTFDGGCRRYQAGPGLGDGSQDEGQDPVFRVENGATLRNVVIGTNGADGIHTYNGAIIDNVYWMDVGEDALTIKSSGTTTVRNIEGYNADDKFFQSNAASTLNVSTCIIRTAGKALRQNGGTTYRINVTFDRCDLNTLDEGVFRTDSSSSTARLTNSRLHDAGTICIGPWASCTQSGNTNY
jgi:pectate lyase C